MNYHIIVFGCQMNISDSERISAVLENMRYKRTLDINEADLIAVVMCSVRQSAVDRIYGLTEKFSALGGKKPITILTGCVLKKDRRKFTDNFDFIINIKNIKNLSGIIEKSVPVIIDNRRLLQEGKYLDIKPKYSSNCSANVPIMTGCNNFCSYCVVPYAREREVSRPAKKIIFEIKNLVKNGYKEIWLLGQNVNSYKDPSEGSGQVIDFVKLLKMVNAIPGNFWIRFTSSHPKDFNDKVINAMASENKITPYLNLPIQSGDNKILESMNRRYTVEDYKNKIKKLRKKIPEICLSTDIIVGFPGETKKQFENTVKLFKDIKYDMAYINKYSTRTGTVAAKLKDNVSIDEKKRREKLLNETLKQTAIENNKKFVGEEDVVLIDGKKGNNWLGKDRHYKTVQVKGPKGYSKNLLGKFVKVKITEALVWSLKGNLTNEK